MTQPIQHFDIRLTPQELDVVANALTQAPWHVVNGLLNNIKAQVDQQQREAQMPQTDMGVRLDDFPLPNGHAVP